MASEKDDTAELTARIAVHKGPAPDLGQVILEREIPSEPALVAPLVVRAVEFLRSEGLLQPSEESRIGLCLEEALQNAVKHGNRKDFKKKVRFQLFLGESEWGVIVTDEGHGFDPGRVKSPLNSEGLWGESGRGLYLMSHYMDRVEYFNAGSTLILAKAI